MPVATLVVGLTLSSCHARRTYRQRSRQHPQSAEGAKTCRRYRALCLGCRARAVVTHGADLLGQLARTALRDAGIDTELLRAVGTSACEVVTTAADGTLRARNAGELGEPVGFAVEAALLGAAATPRFARRALRLLPGL